MAGSTSCKFSEKLAKSLMPNFDYCCTVFSYGLNYVSMRLLNNASHAAVRYVYNIRRRDSVEGYIKRLLGYQLHEFFKSRAMFFLYKLLRTNTPEYLSDIINIGNSVRTYQLSALRSGRRGTNTLLVEVYQIGTYCRWG